MASKILKSFYIFLFLSVLTNAAVDTDTSSVAEDDEPTTKLSPAEAVEPDSRSMVMALDNPVFQWRVNVAPWENFGFSDPYQPKNRDVEEIEDDDTSISAKKPQRPFNPESVISGFGGLLNFDQLSNFGGLDGLFNVFHKVAARKPWWQGPNVCIEREETADTSTTEASADDEKDSGFFSLSSVNMQSCYSTDTKYECVNKVQSRGVKKSYIVRYQCCLGYRRQSGMDEYCEKFDLAPMMETIEKLNASDFIVKNGFENKIQNENLTLFVPTNEAFKSFSEQLLESNNIDLNIDQVRRRRNIDGLSPSQIVEAHTVKGFHDLSPDSILNSNYEDSTLLIDKYIGKNGDLQYLVNCAKVLSPNNYATTGIVHTVDRILLPVTRNIMEELNKHPEFSKFKQVLEKTGLDKELSEDETWTVFVPTNDAFSKLDKKSYDMVTKGDNISKSIVKSHLLGPVLCSSVLDVGVIRVTNANGDIMKLTAPEKTISNEIETDTKPRVAFYVGDSKVVDADIMATHGVIHAIDEVIIPKSALPLITLLERENLTSFRDVILQANMADEIDAMTNVTFYVPTNDAVEKYFSTQESGEVASLLETEKSPTERPAVMVDESKGREFVLHHIAEGVLHTFEMKNNMVTKTLAPQPDSLRINLYSTLPLFPNTFNRGTANCARVVSFGIPQRNNLMHLVGKAVPKADKSVLEMIKSDPNLEYLKKVLADTQLEKDLETLKDITFLAPENKVFTSISKEDFDILTNDKKLADNILRQNTLRGVLCCAGLHYSPWPFTTSARSLTGENFAINNNRIGSTQINDCDHMASNGVLHYTSSILISTQHRIMKSENPNVDVFLYGI